MWAFHFMKQLTCQQLTNYTLAKSVNLVQWSGKLNLIYCSSCDLPHLFVSFLFCFRMVLADIHEPSIYYKEASVNKKSARFCLKQLSIGEETKKKERKSTDSVNIQVVKGKIIKSVFSRVPLIWAVERLSSEIHSPLILMFAQSNH